MREKERKWIRERAIKNEWEKARARACTIDWKRGRGEGKEARREDGNGNPGECERVFAKERARAPVRELERGGMVEGEVREARKRERERERKWADELIWIQINVIRCDTPLFRCESHLNNACHIKVSHSCVIWIERTNSHACVMLISTKKSTKSHACVVLIFFWCAQFRLHMNDTFLYDMTHSYVNDIYLYAHAHTHVWLCWCESEQTKKTSWFISHMTELYSEIERVASAIACIQIKKNFNANTANLDMSLCIIYFCVIYLV